MTTTNFSIKLVVDKTPAEVFKAINNVRGWWSGEISGDTGKAGAEFTYRVPDMHYSKQRITEFISDKKVVWHVTESTLNFIKNTHEWTGSDIIFEIAPSNDQTELRFTHSGLVPAHECYNDCSNAWSVLVNGNLQNLIVTGKDQPSPW